MNVPLIDLRRQYAPLKKDILAVLDRLIDNGNFILGSEVSDFEQEIAGYLGSKYALGVTSGTDALWLSLKALGIGPGDRVLTSPFTFFATISAIVNAGAEPVFADIDPDTYNLDPAAVESVLREDREKRIKAIIPVHLYGLSADMDRLSSLAARFEVALIEDAAQAIGTEFCGKKVGTLSAFGSYSFYPTKNLGAMGDAGLVVTQNELYFEKLQRLRTHGGIQRYYHVEIGSNCRIDALQAGILRVCLPHLDTWISQRQKLAKQYDEKLGDCLDLFEIPKRVSYSNHGFHQYTIRVKNEGRERLQAFLKEQQVAHCVYYPIPCHLQEALKPMGFKAGMFPQAETAAREVLSLPIFPSMTEEEQEWVVNSLLNWYRSNRGMVEAR